MLSLISRRPSKGLLRAVVVSVLAFALATAVIDNTAPAPSNSAISHTSVATICNESVDTVSAGYTRPEPRTADGTRVEGASVAFTGRQLSLIAAAKGKAVSTCENKLGQAESAGWSYLSARAVEIAVDAVITVLASTLICGFTGPVGCAWGVRFGSFAGGFVGALAFQYLTYGFIDWGSVGSAFFDATVSMLAFSGLDKLEEKYVGEGVRATFKSAGQALKAVGNRIGGAGSSMVGSIQYALEYVFMHATSWAFPVGYTGGGSFEPVIAESQGNPIADGLQMRIPSSASGWRDVHDDVYSGTYNRPYYNWDFAETPHTNGDGAVGYLIGQRNNCLTNNNGTVVLSRCNYNDSRQWWFVDGDELMSSSGQCLDEDGTGQQRFAVSCDGLTYAANPNNRDDQFLVTPPGGTFIPDTVTNWKNHLSAYEHA